MKQEIIRIDLQGVNCYLGKSGDSFILFDTGGHTIIDKQFTDRRESLEKELEKAGCKPGNLKLVVLTHGDNDHAANAAYIREKYKAKIAMHPYDLELVENPDIEKVMGSFRYKSLIHKLIFLFMKRIIRKISIKTLDDFTKFRPDILVDEGYSLAEHGFEAVIVHTPGHTAGSIGIISAEGDLVAGDMFTNIKKPDTAPNAYDFKSMEISVDRLRNMNIRTVYPGHGEPFEAKQLVQ
ncbi:MAG: MBL fold metallo-hydrolase [Clostridia bacterium]|nr:MBL fold metallo-hydrolase [Clostridia bacterium]